jgi:hypothetical protein
MKPVLVLAAVLCLAMPALADTAGVSRSPRETGVAVLREVTLGGGRLSILVDTNGCTEKTSFRVDVKKEPGASAAAPRYRLTVRRVVADECKAFLPEGVRIEIDLAKDLGFRGVYTVSVDNPVQERASKAGADAPAVTDLRAALLEATRRAIAMEIDGCRSRLATAEAGTGPKENAQRFRAQLADLEKQETTYDRMRPDEYPAPAAAPAPAPALDRNAASGPVLPAVPVIETGVVDGAARDGAQVLAESASRSGPFYHLAGIAGGDYGALRQGVRYRFTLYLVYKRDYVAFIPDHYVFVARAE